MDALRSVAIGLVMLWHLPRTPGNLVADNGLWGVDLFFVLSGYLIGDQFFRELAAEKGVSLRRFYLRRALRTWAAYFFVLMLYVAFPGFHERSGMAPWWRFVTFTQNFGLYFSAFSHAWSLCIEEQFYLLFPLVALILFKAGSRNVSIAALAMLVLFGVAVRTVLWWRFMGTSHGTDAAYFTEIYYPTWGRLDGLALGVSIAAMRNFWPQAWRLFGARANAVACAGVVILASGFTLQSHRYELLACALGFPLVSLGFAAILASSLFPNSVLGRLRIPGTPLLATLSYSIYLVHKQVFHLLVPFTGKGAAGGTALLFAGSIAAALALHLAVERPFLRLRQRLTSH